MGIKDFIPKFLQKKEVQSKGTLKNGTQFLYLTTGGFTFSNNTKTVEGQLYAYKNCPPVSGIIQKKTNAALNGRWYIENKEGKELTNSKANEVRKLLNNPNELQTWDQFFGLFNMFYETFGNVYIYPVYPFGFEPNYSNINSLWIIPNWIIRPVYKQTGYLNPQFYTENPIEYYQLVNSGYQKLTLSVDEVWLYKNDKHTDETTVLGTSTLFQLDSQVNNIMTAYEARRTLMESKGAIGILSRGESGINAMPWNDEEIKNIQEKYKNNYGLSRDQFQVIMTTQNLNWQSMSFPTKDLLLFEEIEDDVRQLCDNYGYPLPLLGFNTTSVLGDGTKVAEVKKQLYQDTIIPETERFYSWLQNQLKMPDDGMYLRVYFTHIEVLQKSETEKATGFKAISESVINVLIQPISNEQKKYILTYFYEMSEEEAIKLVGNGNNKGQTEGI